MSRGAARIVSPLGGSRRADAPGAEPGASWREMNAPTKRGLPHALLPGTAEMAKRLGTTPRAVRFYEDRDLLQVGRDQLGYRRYDAQARARLSWIVALRRAGMSLPQIRAVLGADNRSGPALSDAAGLSARQCLAARGQELRRSLDEIDALLRRLDSAHPFDEDPAISPPQDRSPPCPGRSAGRRR